MFNPDHMAIGHTGQSVARAGWAGTARVVAPGPPEDTLVDIIEPSSVTDPAMIQGPVQLRGPAARVPVVDWLGDWDEMTGTDYPEVPPRPRGRRR